MMSQQQMGYASSTRRMQTVSQTKSGKTTRQRFTQRLSSKSRTLRWRLIRLTMQQIPVTDVGSGVTLVAWNAVERGHCFCIRAGFIAELQTENVDDPSKHDRKVHVTCSRRVMDLSSRLQTSLSVTLEADIQICVVSWNIQNKFSHDKSPDDVEVWDQESNVIRVSDKRHPQQKSAERSESRGQARSVETNVTEHSRRPAQLLSRSSLFFRGVMVTSLMSTGTDVHHVLILSSLSVSLSL